MPYYNHDMLHCNQEDCKKKDKCYRYWLGQECKKYDNVVCMYYPSKPIKGGCSYFVNKEYFE